MVHAGKIAASAAACLLATAPVQATWSIIVVNPQTKEVAIGAATCLLNFDLQRYLPVVIPEIGAAAAQARVDSGFNRIRIWNEMHAGTDPQTILVLLAQQDGSHQSRQYGIVDTQGRALTFTGTQCGAYASGLTGTIGPLVYAIQGNVITGQPVLDQAEQALRATPGGIPERLMAAMEAARAMGGDGRCSCNPQNPPGCGSPPPQFEKSAHIGFMIVARRGDPEGVCNFTPGCANGIYYMAFNIIASDPGERDPVLQLRERFDAWRAGLIGQVDAVESRAVVDRLRLANSPTASARLRIELRDWRGQLVAGHPPITVQHDQGSAGICQIGPPQPRGDGVYEVLLTANAACGRDRLAIGFSTAAGQRFLMPSPELVVVDARADLNRDQALDQSDLGMLLAAFGRDAGGDIDGDGDTDQADLGLFLTAWSGTCL